jgi:signal transduction histidine kinase
MSAADGTPERVRCLLVDDVEENLVAMSAVLQRGDVEVLCARSGVAALELLLQHSVALALIDVHMPDMDGFELAELMRGSERTRDIPIIFVTAGERDRYRLFQGYDKGAVDFLYKPIEPHVLQGKAEAFFDIHRQKTRLRHQLESVEETLRFNEMFTAVLGHDLRSPLSAIVNCGRLLERHEDPIVRQASARLLSSADRMTHMVQDLLDSARARLAGGIPIARKPADLREVVASVAEEQRTAHPDRPIALTARGDMKGAWDVGRVAQLTANLIGNAIQHGVRDSGVEVLLDGADAAGIWLKVMNAGSIEAHHLARLFDPFRTAAERADPSKGLGLGLYIVQQIARSHAGEVSVDSTAGTTTFNVWLPRDAPHPDAAGSPRPADGGSATPA